MSASVSVADVLESAADLIEPEGAWMQGDYCAGTSIQKSKCFCAYGAIAFVLGCDGMDAEQWGHRKGVDEAFGRGGVVDFNDEHTQAEVVAKLREAAALARENNHA